MTTCRFPPKLTYKKHARDGFISEVSPTQYGTYGLPGKAPGASGAELRGAAKNSVLTEK